MREKGKIIPPAPGFSDSNRNRRASRRQPGKAMSINGIDTTQNLIGILGALNTDPSQVDTDSAASAVGTFMVDPTSGSTSQDSSGVSQANFSQAASQLSTLAKLQNQSPETFKALAKSIAQDISTAARQSASPIQKFMLTSLAGQFSNASASGSLTSLAPAAQSGNRQLRGYGGAQATQVSLFSPAMTQGQGADVFNQVDDVIASNLASLEA